MYTSDNNIICELKKGKGFSKKYKCDNKYIFEGEYVSGKMNGLGKIYYNEIKIYEGEFLNGEKNGKGKEYWDNKLRFEGEYLYGYKSKEKNISMKRWNMKVNICLIKNGKVLDMMKRET